MGKVVYFSDEHVQVNSDALVINNEAYNKTDIISARIETRSAKANMLSYAGLILLIAGFLLACLTLFSEILLGSYYSLASLARDLSVLLGVLLLGFWRRPLFVLVLDTKYGLKAPYSTYNKRYIEKILHAISMIIIK